MLATWVELGDAYQGLARFFSPIFRGRTLPAAIDDSTALQVVATDEDLEEVVFIDMNDANGIVDKDRDGNVSIGEILEDAASRGQSATMSTGGRAALETVTLGGMRVGRYVRDIRVSACM